MENIQNTFDKKKYSIAMILFLVGQIFLVVSTISNGSSIKVLPRWLEAFSGFVILGIAVIIVSLITLLKIKKYFIYSLIAVIFSFIANGFSTICLTSNDPLYYALSKGFELSSDILLLIFYVYFFQGNYLIYKDLGYVDESKKMKKYCIIFLIIHIASIAIQYIAKIPAISHNLIANRVFLYGSWVVEFAVYVFSLVIVIGLVINAKKINKEVENNGLQKE